MHKTLPDDARYPYSQPLVYVFRRNPSEAVKNFVGFATATPGQEALQTAREEEAFSVAQTVAQAISGDANTTATTTPGAVTTPGNTQATTDNTTDNNSTATEGVETATNTSTSSSVNNDNQAFVPGESAGVSTEVAEGKTIPWWWILFPAAVLGALVLWWLLGRRRSQEDDTVTRGVLPDDSPPPFTPQTTSASNAVGEPVATTPVEPGASGINTAGLGLGALGIAGLGAAAASRNQQDTSSVESASELSLDTPDFQQPDIPDTGLDLEAPAAVVNSSYHSLPRISTPIDEEIPPTEADNTAEVDHNNVENNVVPQEELPSSSTSNWLGNFALGGAAAAGAARIKSKLTGKDVSESAVDETLPADNSAVVGDEAAEVEPKTGYSQLPDVWQTPETEQPSGVTEISVNDETLDNSNITEDEQEISPGDLWGNPETEQSTSFPTGVVAGGAAALGGIAAVSSGLWNNQETSENDNNNVEAQVDQQTSPADLWEDSQTEKPQTEQQENLPNITDISDQEQPQITEEAQLSTPDLPEVRIIGFNEQSADAQITPPQEQKRTDADGLPNVWVTQPTTPTETVSEEQSQELAQFGISSNSEDNPASAVAATVLGAGCICGLLLKCLMTMKNLKSKDENPAISEPSASQLSFSEDVALDRIADEAEVDVDVDTQMSSSEPDLDEADTAWDRIYGIHHQGGTGVPGESNILLASRTPKWAYASWNISADSREAMQNRGATQLVLRLYDVTNVDLSYQDAKLVQQYECETTVSHRYVAIPNTDRDYIAEIGYLTTDKEWSLISRSPIVRVFSRPHKDFWFEADAELIIHGATEPGSTVTIEGENIKVKQDGTFHLRVPFTESTINYLITAVAPNSEEARTIHMQFSQKEPKNS
ncbi:MAG: DUF4912 domain-containing protein [Nostocaceae cyanobacterium CSU_2_110]|nr:DUF4912 domain-containing protein [Nostocaceae cyanobacterium CSU_2_110]